MKFYSYEFIRRRLFLKRKLSKLFGFSPDFTTSVYRSEKPLTIESEYLGNYSSASTLTSFDFRSNRERVHSFNERNFFLLKNVILEPHQGLVWDSGGRFIEESTNYPIHQLYNTFPWNPRRELKNELNDGVHLYLTSNGYWHWLVEDLPPFLKLLELYPNSPIIMKQNPPSFIRDFLAMINREPIFVDGPVKVRELLFVEKSQDCGWLHPTDLKVIREFPIFAQIIGEASNPNKKVYTSRRKSKRSPSNENEIEKIFEENGFEIVIPEELSFSDEIKLFSQTTTLASIHGSAHTNMVWMQKGGTILDIANSKFWTEAAFSAITQLDMSYKYLTYEGSFSSPIELDEIKRLFLDN